MRSAFKSIMLSSLLLCGCVGQNRILVHTGTIIGVSIAQNQATGMYEAKLGYARSELAMVPTTNDYTPDVVTELKFSGIFNLTEGGIYQRMAVGPTAVAQSGAFFLKDASGQISTNAVSALKALQTIPTANSSVQGALLRVSTAYRVAINKSAWDEVAKANGYAAFPDFITDTKLTPDTFAKVVVALRDAKLIDQ